MKYWWVNQNQTYEFEVTGFLWSPKTRADGARNYFYETMQYVSPGDVVFSFCETYIKAIGIVQSPATTSAKPDFRTAGSNWANEGWLVEVEFKEIQNPFKPKDFMPQIIPLLRKKYAPLLADGRGKQGIYLTEISEEFGRLLSDLSGEKVEELKRELSPLKNIEPYEDSLEVPNFSQLERKLEKTQIILARRGQGLFKTNVRLIEKHCRVTGVSSIKHLIASHIKPWSQSNDEEKISGYNGLLLSPHIDHLFDRGLITFEDSGNFQVSKLLDPQILSKWNILHVKNVGSFCQEQKDFLNFHRENIFQEK